MSARSPRGVVAVLGCVGFLYGFAQLSIAPALPLIRTGYGISEAAVGWVMAAFFVASASLTGIAGRLGDMFGRRRLLVVSLVALVVGGLVCALAPSFGVLIAGRVIMGGAGALLPLGYAIVRDTLPPERVPSAIGTITTLLGLGAGTGMVLGGVIAGGLGFEWSFVVTALAGLVAVSATLAVVPRSTLLSPARIDWAGAGLLLAGLALLLSALSQAPEWGWTGTGTLVLACAGVACLAVLVPVERRQPEPLVHLPTLAFRPVRVTNLTTLTMGIGQLGASLLVVQLAQVPEADGGLGLDPGAAALLLIPYSLTLGFGSSAAALVVRRAGARTALVTGAVLASCGLGLLALTPQSGPLLAFDAALVGLGVSFAIVSASLSLAQHVERARAGEANGLNMIARHLGMAVGAQLSATVLASHAGGGAAGADSYAVAFVVAAAACAVAACVALTLPGLRRPTVAAAEPVEPG